MHAGAWLTSIPATGPLLSGSVDGVFGSLQLPSLVGATGKCVAVVWWFVKAALALRKRGSILRPQPNFPAAPTRFAF